MIQYRYHQTKEQISEEWEEIRMAQKNPQAFRPLYEKYHEQIFRYIYQRIDDKELAFDTTSQVFLKALTHLKNYEFKGLPFSSWLYRIAKSEVYQLLKDHKAERTLNIEADNVAEMIHVMEEKEKTEEYQLKDKLIHSLSCLTEEDLQLIEMRFFEKRSFKEIGEICEITENNAKVKTYRILDKLKKMITLSN